MIASISLRDGQGRIGHNESMSFAANLKRLMNERGVSSAELGRHLGITGQAVNQWLTHGGTAPRHARLEAIAAYFHIPVSALTDGTTGFGEISVSAFAAPPGPRQIQDIEESSPADDEGYDELLNAADTMLTAEDTPLSKKDFARLAMALWQEVSDIGASVPIAERIATVIERRRRMIIAARRLAVGPWRRR